MIFEMLQESDPKLPSSPEELGWAIFVVGMIFVFLIALYPAILILGQLELREKEQC